MSDLPPRVPGVYGHTPTNPTPPEHNWAPRRRWRIIGADGLVWHETNSHDDAQANMRDGDNLEQLWGTAGSEWRPA